MQQNPTLRARIDGGRVCWQGYEEKRWNTVKRFLEGQEVEISIGRRRKKVSPGQRKYYWAVIVSAFAEEMGCTKDEAHDALRWHFLKVPGRRPASNGPEHRRIDHNGAGALPPAVSAIGG